MPPKVNPCIKIGNDNIKAKEIISAIEIDNKVSTLKPHIATDQFEKGFNFGKNTPTDNYQVSGTYTGTLTGLDMPSTENNFTVYGSFHPHPTLDAYECFSASDFYGFHKARKNNISFSTIFVLGASGSVYNLTITDPVKFINFTNTYPESTYLNPAAGEWKIGTEIESDFRKIEREFIKDGKTQDEACALAQAYVLKKYDMGIGISKQDNNGNFKPIFVKEVKDPADPNKTSYEQTETCNL